MSNKSSYQKLKERISVLENDMYVIVSKPDSIKAMQTKLKYFYKFTGQDLICHGSPLTENNTGDGIISQIMPKHDVDKKI